MYRFNTLIWDERYMEREMGTSGHSKRRDTDVDQKSDDSTSIKSTGVTM